MEVYFIRLSDQIPYDANSHLPRFSAIGDSSLDILVDSVIGPNISWRLYIDSKYNVISRNRAIPSMSAI